MWYPQGFDPPSITVAAGETVTWTNNAGFPHNVVFDEDDVPVRLAKRLEILLDTRSYAALLG